MKIANFLFCFFILILCSCGTTRIQLSKNIKANIYIDGENRGTSPVTITRTGFPTARHVSVKDFKGNEITSIYHKAKHYNWDNSICINSILWDNTIFII